MLTLPLRHRRSPLLHPFAPLLRLPPPPLLLSARGEGGSRPCARLTRPRAHTHTYHAQMLTYTPGRARRAGRGAGANAAAASFAFARVSGRAPLCTSGQPLSPYMHNMYFCIYAMLRFANRLFAQECAVSAPQLWCTTKHKPQSLKPHRVAAPLEQQASVPQQQLSHVTK